MFHVILYYYNKISDIRESDTEGEYKTRKEEFDEQFNTGKKTKRSPTHRDRAKNANNEETVIEMVKTLMTKND